MCLINSLKFPFQYNKNYQAGLLAIFAILLNFVKKLVLFPSILKYVVSVKKF